LTCHEGQCPKCDETVSKKCLCGKTTSKYSCFSVNYPDSKRELIMTQEEMDAITYLCPKVCNKFKSCGKHKCQEICCTANRELGPAGDPLSKHLCQIVCDKKLSCGEHNCTDFCHKGFCKPCKWVSIKPVYCPCGIAKMDPPVKCGEPLPKCGGPCATEQPCGHPCSRSCHGGSCPPCLEPVERLCKCGKELKLHMLCKDGEVDCGKACGIEL